MSNRERTHEGSSHNARMNARAGIKSLIAKIVAGVSALVPRRDLVTWTCPVCARDVQVTPYEREYRIGHAEACDHCTGGRDD